MAALYYRVKREPLDGSISAAIRVHAQACGFVAYVFDTHPDRVAEAVRDDLPYRLVAAHNTERESSCA